MDEQKFPPAFRFPTGRREVIFGALTLICCIFLWNAVLYGGFHLGFALGSIALIGCSVWYLHGCGHRFDRYSGTLILFALLISAGFGWASAYLKPGMLLMLVFSVNLGFCLVTGRNRRSSGGLSSVLDAPRAFFRFGFGGMDPAIRGLNDARKNAGAAGKAGSAALIGLVAAVPVVAVLTVLMMRSDAAFEGLMDLLPETDWSEPFWSVAFGVIAGWILYARALGLRYQPEPVRSQRTFRGISTITVNILLLAVSGLYCVYLFSQLAYMGGGFSGVLPEGYTLAQYARRGFFEMAWLSAINLGLMCVSMGLVEKTGRGFRLTRGLCLFLGLAALFLICAASAKMLLYINSYGLTRLRVLTEVFMIWLAITTILVCVWLFRPGFPYMRPVVVAALILSTLTFWLDIDARVAQYNVWAYRSGKLETVDMAHLSSLGYGAVPYIAQLRGDEDPELSDRADSILRQKNAEIQDFRDWNYVEANARRILSGPKETNRLEDIVIHDTLTLSLTGAEVLESWDTHEGFHGDGKTFTVLQFPAEQNEVMVRTAESNPLWHPLPLTENLSLVLYGSGSGAPLFVSDAGEALLPGIQNGFYFFRDRHSASTDDSDDSQLLTRASYNFTLAVYDADTHILYYFELDT